MSSTIDAIVSVTVRVSSATPSLPSVSIPAVVGYHDHYAELIKTYTDPAQMIDDGFDSDEPCYLAAVALCRKSPRVATFKVIRVPTTATEVVKFKVTAAPPTGKDVGLVLTGPDGTDHEIKHTVTVGQTAAQVATALAAIVVAGLTLVVDGVDTTQVNITINAAGALWYPKDIYWGELTVTSGSASADDALTDAANVDPDFYGVVPTFLDATNIDEIADWCETNKRQLWYTTADTANINTTNLGIFATLEGESYDYSVGIYNAIPRDYAAATWVGGFYTTVAGAATAAYNTLPGVTPDALTPTQIQNAGQLRDTAGKNGNVYIVIASTNNTVDGISASGIYADVRRGIDQLVRDIQVRVFGAIKAAADLGSKIPYTDAGIAALANGEVAGTLQAAVQSTFLSGEAGEAPVVTYPKKKDIAPALRKARILPDINFSAVAQGAIQRVRINGVVTF